MNRVELLKHLATLQKGEQTVKIKCEIHTVKKMLGLFPKNI